MKRVFQIAGLLGYLVAVYSVLSSITVAPPAFNAARLYLEEKTKNEPLSPFQSSALKESLDAAKRLSEVDQSRKAEASLAAQLGLVLIATVCLVAGFSGNDKKRAIQRATDNDGAEPRHV